MCRPLLKEGTGALREHELDDDVRVDGRPQRVRGHARFDRTPQGVLVRARLRGELQTQCSRCLRSIAVPMDVVFDEVYVPMSDVNTGARITPDEGAEDAYRIDERHMLDLSEAVAQYWSMAEPMAPLCDEGCRGVCAACGAVMVEGGAHECPRAERDPRWAKLADLDVS